MVYKRSSSTKKELLTAIRQNRNYFYKEYLFKPVIYIAKSMKAIIKSQNGIPK